MNATREIAGVMFARRLQLLRYRWHVAIVPDGVGTTDSEAVVIRGDPHRFAEGVEVRVEGAAVLTDQNDFAGLISGDHEADLQLLKKCRQVGGMYAAERGRFSGGGHGSRGHLYCLLPF